MGDSLACNVSNSNMLNHRLQKVALALLVIAFLLVAWGQAQQSSRSYQKLSGQVLRSSEHPEKKAAAKRGLPMRFKGWSHPEKYSSDYLKHFSRPRARMAHAELMKNAARAAAHNSSPSAPFAPSALPGFLLRDSPPDRQWGLWF